MLTTVGVMSALHSAAQIAVPNRVNVSFCLARSAPLALLRPAFVC